MWRWLAPVSVTLNGQAIKPIVCRAKNSSAMPLGDDNGAPDADVFEVTVPATSVFTSNLVVAAFASTAGVSTAPNQTTGQSAVTTE